ncbi:pollen-specific leucine-rich repeat extensin 1 isoform X2 [Labeo rohita]|uniref:Pollen-specific leucine-rich repeat extensin 1 isoform X2 n=1 Tax=Labeo rohita TaxID=84645 RepID=A0A498M1Y7_LABRO|nr:pollen-specific leucine-rich repeat extensin 1 isoform X2 [Labeo rohita]
MQLDEDEENEYVEYTGKTIQACDSLKSERPRLLEAEINPRMPAWVESDSEVLEEVWASEVVEVLGFEEEKDSKAIEGHLDEASQKKETDEHMIKMFCVTSPEGPKNETQHHVNVQKEPKSKRKVPLVLFIWGILKKIQKNHPPISTAEIECILYLSLDTVAGLVRKVWFDVHPNLFVGYVLVLSITMMVRLALVWRNKSTQSDSAKERQTSSEGTE